MKVKFRCMKDKVEVEEEPLDIKKLPNRNGLFLVTSVHSKCGTNLSKIVGIEEAKEIAKFLHKDVESLETHVKKGKGGACDCKDGADEKEGAHWEDGDEEKVGSAQKKKKHHAKKGGSSKKRKSKKAPSKARKSAKAKKSRKSRKSRK